MIAAVNEEVLRTLICKVEFLLNGRPLTHVSINPGDLTLLTPNHILLGHENPNLSPDVFDDNEIISRQRWRSMQALVDCFWRRWLREYATTLVERKKWLLERGNLQFGHVGLPGRSGPGMSYLRHLVINNGISC